MEQNKKESWLRTKCQNLEPCTAWIALGAAVLLNMLLNLSDSFGVYYNALVDKYDATRAEVGWVLSVRWIFIFASAIFISPFIEIFGCRPVTLVSAFLYALGTSLSATAPSISSLYFIYGFLTGFGNCGIYLAVITAIQQLFSANRGFATCIRALGFPLGLVIHPLHAQYFLDLYGVSGLFLMHGGISLQGLILSFALNTRSQNKSKREKTAADKKSQDSPKTEKTSTQSEKEEAKGKNEDVNRDHPQLDQKKNASEEVAIHEKQNCFVVKEYFRQITDFKVLRNVSLVLVIIHFSLLWMVRLGITTQIINCAKFRGLPDDKASYLLSLSGAINLAMTIVSAVVMNTSWSNPALYSGLASVCFAGSAFGCAFSNSFGTFLTTAVFIGVADGIAMANLPLLTLHVVGLEKFPRSMAVVWTLLVPSAVGSSAFVGWMVDMLEGYVIAFVVLGVLGVVSTVLALSIVIIEIKKRRRMIQDTSINISIISVDTFDTRM